jgi:hypothetical protein
VIRFQIMAPLRAARIRTFSITPGDTIPVPIVWATGAPMLNAATKLKKAAQYTAYWGGRTLVDTTQDIELAASWKPLMKSKAKAIMIMEITKISVGSTMLKDYALHDI